VGLDLGFYPNAQAEGITSVCPYRGLADCFDAVITGDTGGNVVHWEARATPDLLPAGTAYPRFEIPAFSNGWSGRVCLKDLQCQTGATGCSVTGNWYAIWATVQGGERNSVFNICLTSLKAVTSG
jgi:hypothetical protein